MAAVLSTPDRGRRPMIPDPRRGTLMKKVTVLILALLIATVAFADDPMKGIDNSEYTIDAPGRLEITGELTESSPTFSRWRPNDYQAVSVDCMLPMEYNYSTEPYYDTYCLNVTDGEAIEVVVTDASFDTVIYLYCDPFDPINAMDNAVIFDDDDGAGLQSAIQLTDNVMLTPGNDYWLVVCAYSSQTGTFTIQTSDNVELCGGVPVQNSDWSSIKQLFE